MLAHVFSGHWTNIPPQLKNVLYFEHRGLPQPQLLPILVTGSREPVAVALMRSLYKTLRDILSRGRSPIVLQKIQEYLEDRTKSYSMDAAALQFISEANEYVRESGKGRGLLIILDELGKFLEYAALYPDRQDVFFLQQLAEAAARSTKKPIFIVGLLHQGFHAYADQLSQSTQKEWEKVAGRFEELLFKHPLEETAHLIASALNVCLERLPADIANQARRDMEVVVNLGWYGPGTSIPQLIEPAPKLYPLHPTVISVLAKLLQAFGQMIRDRQADALEPWLLAVEKC